MIFVILMGFAGSLLAGYIGILIFSLLGSYLPFVYLDFLEYRRSKKFEAQLPEALRTLSHLLRAGYSIPQAVKIASDESLNPLRSEFARVVRENQLGLSIEEAMSNLAKRINNQSLDWTVTAISIQKDVG
jgi:tight adherence protein B